MRGFFLFEWDKLQIFLFFIVVRYFLEILKYKMYRFAEIKMFAKRYRQNGFFGVYWICTKKKKG